MNSNAKRVHYIDNLRWIIIVLVVVFHVVDVFNTTGAKIHYNYYGISAFDSIAYLVYPWFMCVLFVLAGISARLSLEKRSTGKFISQRVHKLFIPFICYNLIFGMATSAFCFTVTGGWNDFAAVPKFVLAVIMLCIGMGHTWFIIELFALSLIFLAVRRLDKKNILNTLGEKCNIIILLLMYIPLLGASQVLNLLGVMRNLLFFLLYLLGYYVFSCEKVLERLKKVRYILLIFSVILGILQTCVYWGQDFSMIVNKPLVMLFTWITLLSIFANAPTLLDFENGFTRYMSKRSFGIYLFHYLPMIIISYFLTKNTSVPVILDYPLVLILDVIATLAIVEIFYRLPVVNKLFGLK